jgi:2-oxoglutarate ferredoxin oxidoreductase subunit alpha
VISNAAKSVKHVVVVEMNLGQYVCEVQRVLPDKRVAFLGRMDGRLITPDQIKEAISNG